MVFTFGILVLRRYSSLLEAEAGFNDTLISIILEMRDSLDREIGRI